MPIPFADNFLAGSIITLLMPVGLLIVIAVWYTIGVRRLPEAREPQHVDPDLVSEPQVAPSGDLPAGQA